MLNLSSKKYEQRSYPSFSYFSFIIGCELFYVRNLRIGNVEKRAPTNLKTIKEFPCNSWSIRIFSHVPNLHVYLSRYSAESGRYDILGKAVSRRCLCECKVAKASIRTKEDLHLIWIIRTRIWNSRRVHCIHCSTVHCTASFNPRTYSSLNSTVFSIDAPFFSR